MKEQNQPTFNDVMPCCIMCGAPVKGRWENLSKGLCLTLIKFFRSLDSTRPFLHLQKECNFTKNEYNNFQKLKYFGLAEPDKLLNGYWRITSKGLAFLHGHWSSPKKVFVFRNAVQSKSDETISITQLMKSNEKFWLKKEDFVAQSAPAEIV